MENELCELETLLDLFNNTGSEIDFVDFTLSYRLLGFAIVLFVMLVLIDAMPGGGESGGKYEGGAMARTEKGTEAGIEAGTESGAEAGTEAGTEEGAGDGDSVGGGEGGTEGSN
ncbi:hypothetical protein AVEN_269764-1 [Araneus ventricosus]|uniref:Uncharacterized protein n=1 Tax=Araneus ventricosus TaxID=182803 RepID=A0A4Y2U9F0_ARAVE|nr:hypothetical protein AVEN_269764-1 [Araneus ventricosus]